ncbi:MAG: hypothetical protein V3S41_07765 [Spirochaetia bacterium]
MKFPLDEAIAQRPLHGYLERVPRRMELVEGSEGGFALAPGAVYILFQECGSW